MSRANLLSRLVARLKVRPETALQVAEILADSNSKEMDYNRLYQEWVNETVVVLSQVGNKDVLQDPDAAFVAWVRNRVKSPFHIGLNVHNAVRTAYGDEVSLAFRNAIWPQEIAWAQRMRGDESERIAVLAETWLKATTRDAARMFRSMIEIYVGQASFDASYIKSPLNLLSVDEILDGDITTAHWRPLWLRSAEKEFGAKINQLPRVTMAKMADRIRLLSTNEKTARRNARFASHLRRFRPSLVPGVMRAAVRNALSSDDLILGESDFIGRVSSGVIPLETSRLPGWQIFLTEIKRWAGMSPMLDEAGRNARIQAVFMLPPYWHDGVPSEFKDIGGSQDEMVRWASDIISGLRYPPSDHLVDYGLWLIERDVAGKNL